MRFLFLGGCERSGTTLVQRILCSHSRITGGPEFLFTWRIAELFERMRGEYPDEFAVRLAAYYDEPQLKRAFRRFFADFFEQVDKRCPGALWVSEKTPSNISAAKTLLELFPDARFLHVVRDGRDVLASHRAVVRRLRAQGRPDRGSLGTRAACARWNGAIDAHFRLEGDAALRERYHLVRYEELVNDPERVLAELFAFVKLDLEAAALEPGNLAAEESGLVVDGIWVTSESAGRGFDPSGVGRWRAELPVVSRLLANLLMGRNLHRLGYPVGTISAAVSRLLFRLRAQSRGSKTGGRARLPADC